MSSVANVDNRSLPKNELQNTAGKSASVTIVDHHAGIYGEFTGMSLRRITNPLNIVDTFSTIARFSCEYAFESSKQILTNRAKIIGQMLSNNLFKRSWKLTTGAALCNGKHYYMEAIFATLAEDKTFDNSASAIKTVLCDRFQANHLYDFLRELAKKLANGTVNTVVAERCFEIVPFKSTLRAVATKHAADIKEKDSVDALKWHFNKIDNFDVPVYEYLQAHQTVSKPFVVDKSYVAHLKKHWGKIFSAFGHVGGMQPNQSVDVQTLGMATAIGQLVTACCSSNQYIGPVAPAIGVASAFVSAFVIEGVHWWTLSPPKELAPLNNLTEEILHGGVPPLVGHDQIIEQIFSLWSKSEKKHILLVGNSNAVKTAILLELARRLSEKNEMKKQAPKEMQGKLVFGGSAALLMGSPTEQQLDKFHKIVDEMLEHREQIIIALNDIHTLLKTSATDNNSLQNTLKVIYSKLTYFICTTSKSEFEGWAKHQGEFLKFFEVIKLPPDMVKGYATKAMLQIEAREHAPERDINNAAFDLLANQSIDDAKKELYNLLHAKRSKEKSVVNDAPLTDIELRITSLKERMAHQTYSEEAEKQLQADLEALEKQKEEAKKKLAEEKRRLQKFDELKAKKIAVRKSKWDCAFECQKLFKEYQKLRPVKTYEGMMESTTMPGCVVSKYSTWDFQLNKHAFARYFEEQEVIAALDEMEQEMKLTVNIDEVFVQQMRKEKQIK